MNLCRTLLIGLALRIAASTQLNICVAQPSPAPHPGAASQLATELMRVAMGRLAIEPLTVEALEGAVLLAQEAVQLDPSNPEVWRTALEMASAAEHDDLRVRAIERLSQLDPTDEAVRLMRLNLAIERYQTVEARAEAYEKLLSDENIAKIGRPVASRLAFDLALLRRRQGDREQFSQRLLQALTLDPANRSAAAVAAGFFRMNVEDAVGEAELLVNLMVADPTDLATQVALAQLLLENGAYGASERIYRLATRCFAVSGSMPTNALLADAAAAYWANGNDAAALETIRRRQAELDDLYRFEARRQDPNLTIIEVATITAPLDPTLATMRAVILASQRADRAPEAAAAALTAFEQQIQSLTKDGAQPDPRELAQIYLQMAWTAGWLGYSTPDQIAQYVALAEQHQALDPQAKQRFDGLIALRQGEFDKAVELLAPLAENDIMARYGLAMAHLEQGRKRDAAREFLAVNQAQPGTLMGISAANELAALLGRRVPLSDQATKLEQLIASIPTLLDRYPEDPSLAIGLRLSPHALNFGPYEPILVDVELTNNSIYPWVLDRSGPIRPQILFEPTVRTAAAAQIGDLRPFVVDIGRKLTLRPRESVRMTVDLRRYLPGDVLNAVAVHGAIVRLRAQVNFIATPVGVTQPGLYGREIESPIIRVDGVRTDTPWVQQSIAIMQDPAAPRLLEQMALLSHAIGPPPPANMSDANRQLLEAARAAFADAFSRLDAYSQAWLLAVMPRGSAGQQQGLQPVLSMTMKSENRYVKMCYLLFHCTGLNDPMLDAARRGEDPTLQRLATLIHAAYARAAGMSVKPSP